MTYIKDFIMPPTGETIDSARLVAWAVQAGEVFQNGDTLLEIETDKSVIEIPATEDGKMIEHLVGVDGLLNSDTIIAKIEVAGVAGVAPVAENTENTSTTDSVPAIAAASTGLPDTPQVHQETASGSSAPTRKFSTPSARRLAHEHAIVIDTVLGTGPNGRVTQSDVAALTKQNKGQNHAIQHPDKSGRATHKQWVVSTSHGDIHTELWTPAAPRNLPTVVLIHGMFGDMDTWAGTISALSRAGASVLAIDLPGHGKTTSVASELPDIIDAVAEALASVSSGPLVLVGHSFGAAVAARLAARPGANINALVLISPVGLGTEINQSFLTGTSYAGSDEALARELRKLTNISMKLSGTYLKELRASLQQRTQHMDSLCKTVSWNGVQQISIMPDLLTTPSPVVLIHGRQDAIIPWEHALNAPARVALHLVPDAGHMPQWEAATLTTDIILKAATY